MTIVSLSYFIFIAVSIPLYYAVKKSFRWTVLLAASLVFFCLAGTPYTLVYLLSAGIVTWLAGVKIHKVKSERELPDAKKRRRAGLWLAAALCTDLGLLAALKYTNFILRNASFVFNIFSGGDAVLSVNWPAALGISFYSLQIVGYILDVYWGIGSPERNPAKFMLFACFFPQMVSGPISKHEVLGPELYDGNSFDRENLRSGLIRMVQGIFKKLVLAENLNVVAGELFSPEKKYGILFMAVGVAVYVIQIYADFSGCMDIVLGTAKCFGISMPENFKLPFGSGTIQEFWQRWHITLGAWLKDYVMYPLLRSRSFISLAKKLKKRSKKAAKTVPTYIAMLILWLAMGLWHGGGWNYIIEGIWFWLVIVSGKMLAPVFKKITSHFNTENKLWVLFRCVRTTLIYTVGALFFKAGSVAGIAELVGKIFASANPLEGLGNFENTFIAACLSAVLGFAVFLIFNHIERKSGSLAAKLKGQPAAFQLLIVAVILYIVIIFGVYGPGYDAAEFIYGGF